MKITNFIGIDVSKLTLDICLVQQNKIIDIIKIPNSKQALNSTFARFKKQYLCDCENTLCCLEYTGIYNNRLLDFLWQKNFKIWLERAVQIKQSIGVTRGKNDQIDACRIAMYCYKNQQDCRLWQPERKQITLLKTMLTTRNRLIKVQKQLSVPLKEAGEFMDKELRKLNEVLMAKPLKYLNDALEKIELEILQVLKGDATLKHLFTLVKSVDGVGPIVAANIIAKTNEFKNYTDPRKFACFAGIAPFQHSSGTSIRGRTRVSHMANKQMKTLMHLSALSAINAKGELGEFYRRKVAEGKNKMSVVNAVRNKIIARIFAVIKRNEPYRKNYEIVLG